VPPPPSGQGLGSFLALDELSGLIYSQPPTGSDGRVSVFDIHARKFRDPLPPSPSGRASVLECLHYDNQQKRLGALVQGGAAGGGYDLVSIDVQTGKWSAPRASVPALPSGVEFVRSPGKTALDCTLSQTSGKLALFAAKVDHSAPLWCQHSELYVIDVDTRDTTGVPPPKAVRIDLDVLAGPQSKAKGGQREGQAGGRGSRSRSPGSEWRLVTSFLQYAN
jgi:hypothetical protein